MPAYQRLNGGNTRVIVVGCVLAASVVVGLVCFISTRIGAPESGDAAGRAHNEVIEAKEHEVVHADHDAAPHREPRAEHPAANSTESGNSSHHATAVNHTDNASDANDTNRSHNDTECRGGASAACECILQCDVFSNASTTCQGDHHEKEKLVGKLMSKAMTSHQTMCRGMICIMECARQLDCLDARITRDCVIVKENYATSRMPSDPACNLQCEG